MTQEALCNDGPLFDFVLLDEPYPRTGSYWPHTWEVTPYCFLEFGEAIMETLFRFFRGFEGFDPYDVTDFQTESELGTFIILIDCEIAMFEDLDRKMFLERFGSSLEYLAAVHHIELSADQWQIIRSDFIEILRIVRRKAEEALLTGKTLSIVGI